MTGMLAVNVTSFVKSLLIAMYYGTSAELDAYFLSLAPLRLIVGVIIGAVHAALIPTYLDLTVKKGETYAVSLFGAFAAWLLSGVLGLSAIVWIGSQRLAALLGTGFTPAQIMLTASFLRSSTILLALTIVNELGLCLFTAHRQFWRAGWLPLISGACSLAILLALHAYGVPILMFGLIGGMFVQTCAVMYAGRGRWTGRFQWLAPSNPDMRQMLHALLPLLIGGSLGHVNLVVDQIMASTLPAGSIAALHYANKLHSVVTQMFIMMISHAVLPFFARQAAEHDLKALRATFGLTIKRTLLILAPLSLLILAFGRLGVQIMFQRGAFSVESTAATTSAWQAYTLSLPVMAVGILTARVYNALRANTLLMYVSGLSVGLNIVFNWLFMQHWGHTGIALSTSAVYGATTTALLMLLPRSIRRFQQLPPRV